MLDAGSIMCGVGRERITVLKVLGLPGYGSTEGVGWILANSILYNRYNLLNETWAACDGLLVDNHRPGFRGRAHGDARQERGKQELYADA